MFSIDNWLSLGQILVTLILGITIPFLIGKKIEKINSFKLEIINDLGKLVNQVNEISGLVKTKDNNLNSDELPLKLNLKITPIGDNLYFLLDDVIKPNYQRILKGQSDLLDSIKYRYVLLKYTHTDKINEDEYISKCQDSRQKLINLVIV